MCISKIRPRHDLSSQTQAPTFWWRRNKDSIQGFTLVEILLSLLLISIAIIPFLKYFMDSAQLELFTRRELTSDYVAQQVLEEVKAGKIQVTDALSFERGAYTVRITKTPLDLVDASGSMISTGDTLSIDLQDHFTLTKTSSDLTLTSTALGMAMLPSDLTLLIFALEGNSSSVQLTVSAKDDQDVVHQLGSMSYTPGDSGFDMALEAKALTADQQVLISNASSVVFNLYSQTDGGGGFVFTQEVADSAQPIRIQYGALTNAAEGTNTEKTYRIVVEIYQDGQKIEYVDSVLREQ